MQSTLRGIQDDVAYIRGEKHYSDIEIKELEDDGRWRKRIIKSLLYW